MSGFEKARRSDAAALAKNPGFDRMESIFNKIDV